MRVDRRLNPACFSVASGVWRENVIWSNCSFVLYHSVVDADGEFGFVLFFFFFVIPASYPSLKNYEPISVKQGLVQCLSNRLGHFVFHEGNLHFKLIPLPYWKVLGVRISQIPFSYLYILH